MLVYLFCVMFFLIIHKINNDGHKKTYNVLKFKKWVKNLKRRHNIICYNRIWSYGLVYLYYIQYIIILHSMYLNFFVFVSSLLLILKLTYQFISQSRWLVKWSGCTSVPLQGVNIFIYVGLYWHKNKKLVRNYMLSESQKAKSNDKHSDYSKNINICSCWNKARHKCFPNIYPLNWTNQKLINKKYNSVLNIRLFIYLQNCKQAFTKCIKS